MIGSIFLAAALQQQASPLPVAFSAPAAKTAAEPVTHRVAPGETLSSIAPLMGESWPQLYVNNRSVVGGDPNLIYVGEMLHAGPVTPAVTAYTSHLAMAGAPSTAPAVPPVQHAAPVQHYQCGDGDGDGFDLPCSQLHSQAPAPAPAPAAPVQQAAVTYSSSGTFHGSGSMQQCIIAAESGGNSQVVNASGHYGLYQFSYSTWVGSGGNGADFGHASVAEQNQVFANAVAARGYSDWTPYDGC
jgi:hypothetical protein